MTIPLMKMMMLLLLILYEAHGTRFRTEASNTISMPHQESLDCLLLSVMEMSLMAMYYQA